MSDPDLSVGSPNDIEPRSENQLRVAQFAELRRRYGVHKMMELMDHRDWDVVFDVIKKMQDTLQMIANDDPSGKYGRWAREALSHDED